MEELSKNLRQLKLSKSQRKNRNKHRNKREKSNVKKRFLELPTDLLPHVWKNMIKEDGIESKNTVDVNYRDIIARLLTFCNERSDKKLCASLAHQTVNHMDFRNKLVISNAKCVLVDGSIAMLSASMFDNLLDTVDAVRRIERRVEPMRNSNVSAEVEDRKIVHYSVDTPYCSIEFLYSWYHTGWPGDKYFTQFKIEQLHLDQNILQNPRFVKGRLGLIGVEIDGEWPVTPFYVDIHLQSQYPLPL